LVRLQAIQKAHIVEQVVSLKTTCHMIVIV